MWAWRSYALARGSERAVPSQLFRQLERLESDGVGCALCKCSSTSSSCESRNAVVLTCTTMRQWEVPGCKLWARLFTSVHLSYRTTNIMNPLSHPQLNTNSEVWRLQPLTSQGPTLPIRLSIVSKWKEHTRISYTEPQAQILGGFRDYSRVEKYRDSKTVSHTTYNSKAT